MLLRTFLGLLLLCSGIGYSQNTPSESSQKEEGEKIATIDMYKIISPTRDTTYVDTSLTIQSEYRFNYLRKDNFGLMPFANIGQTYNHLDFGIKEPSYLAQFGFEGKHNNYLESDDINYYHVPTPYTQLYYRSVMEQGQNVDAFFTVNTSENLNMSIAYKGLRSIGKYINVLTSTGNFRYTMSYHTDDKRYVANGHVVYQDMYTSENGGIKDATEFESGSDVFKERGTLDVNLRDANTMLKGNRFFLDHFFRINKSTEGNQFKLVHQVTADRRFFEYNQTTANSYFGSAYLQSQLNDHTDFRHIKNRMALAYDVNSVGEIKAVAENVSNSYYYRNVLFQDGQIISSKIIDNWWFAGAEYSLSKKKYSLGVKYIKGLTDSSIGQTEVDVCVSLGQQSKAWFKYLNINKRPDYQNNLYQSKYIAYNWSNNFKTEKYHKVKFGLESKIVNLFADVQLIQDYMYFSNDSTTSVLVTPKQYSSKIGYVGLKAQKEFKFSKFALDNTILYQYVKQSSSVLNMPELVLRNTLYYSNAFFKKALFMQMGVTFNYFSEYNSDIYNPLIGSFYVQNQKAIGGYPVFDVFINAKVKTARLYLKAEHFNSSFSNNNFYSDPLNPYRDFVVRFGIIWAFFH